MVKSLLTYIHVSRVLLSKLSKISYIANVAPLSRIA